MTCDTALAHMLDAEPGELLGRGDTAFAGHLRECPRCGAVAAALAADLELLATAVRPERAARRPARTSRRSGRPLIIVGALTATVVAALALATRTRRTPLRPTVDARTAVAARPSRPVAAHAGAPNLLQTARRFPTPRPVRVEPVRPVPPPPASHVAATLAVRPPAGVRAAVLRTADSRITVVWLY